MGKGPLVCGRVVDELGNYAACRIEDETGVVYNSAEQYFQAHKCALETERETMLKLASADACARYGRKVRLVDDWDSIRFGVMKRANTLKFAQNEHLRTLLVSTNPHRLFFCENGVAQDQWDVWNEQILTELRKEWSPLPLRGVDTNAVVVEEATYDPSEPVRDDVHLVAWLHTPDGFLPFCSCGATHHNS